MSVVVNFKRLAEDAKVPYQATMESAGYDLYAASREVCKSGETVKVHTGLCMEIPSGYFGGIFARSGLAVKSGIRPANCVAVIDADYRGEIIVPLHNDSNSDFLIEKGERIAQLIILPYLDVSFNEVDELNMTGRGVGGFGSTGKK